MTKEYLIEIIHEGTMKVVILVKMQQYTISASGWWPGFSTDDREFVRVCPVSTLSEGESLKEATESNIATNQGITHHLSLGKRFKQAFERNYSRQKIAL